MPKNKKITAKKLEQSLRKAETQQQSQLSKQLETLLKKYLAKDQEYKFFSKKERAALQIRNSLEAEIIKLVKQGAKVRKKTKLGVIVTQDSTPPKYKEALEEFKNKIISLYPDARKEITELYEECKKKTSTLKEKVIVGPKDDLEKINTKKYPVLWVGYESKRFKK